MTAADLVCLPAPDEHGNFWFGAKPGDADSPAILVSGSMGYIVQLGRQGMLWDGAVLKRFSSPQTAHKALKRALREER